MAAFLACVISYLKSGRSLSSQHLHPLNLPMPPITHYILDHNFIHKFKEVFIIGDVHGCYDEMELLLKKADALHKSTLKIFVGDLVNKGPKSAEVIHRLRNMPSSLSVRGNHDEIIIQEYFNSLSSDYRLREKYKWIKNVPKGDIEYLCKLPFTISIPCFKAIIVHAGLVPGRPLEGNSLEDMLNMRNLVVRDHFGEGGIQATKRDTEGEPWGHLWPGINHVYFGHDAKRMLQRYEYATGLDTGCVYGNQLTGLFISGPKKGTFVSVEALKVYCPCG